MTTDTEARELSTGDKICNCCWAEIDTPNGTHEEIGAAVIYTAHEGQALEAAE